MGERRGMKALEIWCRRITKGYPGVRITNMTTSWRNGLGFCAIIHHFRPDLIDFDSLRPDDIYKNNALAFETAESSLSVPALLDPQDMVDYEVPDRLSILTYVSQFYQAFVGQQGVPRTEKDSDVAPPSPESASPSSEKHVATSVRQREPCSVCQLPVFLAERMLIERRLVHRTCFTCARCRSQLSTANYYITEDGQFCCEVCPDEEIGGRVEKTAAVLAHERAVLAGPADDPLSEDADAVLDREDTAAAEDTGGAARGRREDSSGSSDSESDSAESESESESAGGARRVRTDVAINGVGHGDGATGRGAGTGTGGGASGLNGVSAEETVEGSVSATDATSSAGADDIRGTDGGITAEVSAETARDSETGKVTEKVPAKDTLEESDKTATTEAVEASDSRTPPAPAPRSGSPRSTSSASASPSPSTAAASEADTATGNRLSLVQQRLQQFKAAERPQPAPRKPARSPQQPPAEGDATPPEETTVAGETAKGGEGTERASPPAEAANPFGDDEGEEEEVEKEKETEKKKGEEELNPFGSDGEDETADANKATSNGVETDVDKSSQGAATPTDTPAAAAETPTPESSPASAAATEAGDSDSCKPTAVPSVSVTVTEPTPPRPPAPPKEYNPFDDDEEEEGGDEDEENSAATSEPPKAGAKSEPASTAATAARAAAGAAAGDEEEYPDDLNPFGDDEEESTSATGTAPAAAVAGGTGGTKTAKPASLNPFGDSDEEEDEVELRTPSSSAYSTPAKPASATREINPFEKPPRPPPPTLDRRKLASMRASVTPPRPPEPPGLVREQRAGSLTSLPGSSSKKKRPAPRPPGVDSPTSRSQGVSPALSPAHSPSTLRKRHAPPPPPPPVVASGTPPPTTAAAPAPAEATAGADGEAPGSPERSKAAKEQDNYSKQGGNNITTNKSVHGQFKRRKGPAPLRPKPIKRQVRTLPPKETQTELHDISVRQLELERQGVELEKTIRQLTEQDDKSQKELDSTAPYGLDIEDMILQLFELVNEKNALFRRQAELMYMRRQHRLEEEHAELEYEIRCLMMKADALKTDMERQREQRLIERLVSVVEQRNEIVTMLEMERIREIQEDATIDHHMGLYAAERTGSVEPTPEKKKKKKKKKDKKEKEGSSKKKGRDDDKDIDEKEHVPEKKKSKKIKLKKLFS